MNKKNVALAILLTLGFNSLIGGVNSVNGQGFLSYAQDRKLIGNEFRTLSFETLKTSVVSSTGDSLEVVFDNLDLTTVEDIEDVKFEHNVFGERVEIDGYALNAKGVFDKKRGKLIVSNLTEPGIYTGLVKVHFKNGKGVRNYAITLVKKPNDYVSFDSDITTGKVILKNFKINNKSIDSIINNEIEVFINGVKGEKINGGYEVSLLDLKNIKKGETLEVQVKYGQSLEHSLKSFILLVNEEKPVINAYGTNGSSLESISDSIEKSFGVAPSIISLSSNIQNYKYTIDGKEVVSFTQTLTDENVLGGAEISATQSQNDPNVLDIKLGSLSLNSNMNHYVPNVVATFSGNGTPGDVLGIYKVSLNGDVKTYFDADSNLKLEVNSDPLENFYIYSKGAVKKITPSEVTLDLKDNLTHGYTSVEAVFSVDALPIINEITSLEEEVGVEPPNQVKINRDNESIPSKTSLILETDSLDALTINVKFEREDSNKGRVIISGKGLNKGLNPTLNISNVSSKFLSEESDDNKLVFSVEFNNSVGENTPYTLNILGEVIHGEIDLTGGEVEEVNGEISFIDNNDGSFRADASFYNKEINKGEKLFVSTLNTNGVDLDRILVDSVDTTDDGYNYVRSEIKMGKYQGIYVYGIEATRNPIYLKLEAKESDSNIIVKINNDFVNEEDYKNIKEAKLLYKEKSSNSKWMDSNIKLTSEDFKERVITREIDGLSGGKTYSFKVFCVYNDTEVYSNIAEATFPNTQNNKPEGPDSGGNQGGNNSGGSEEGDNSGGSQDGNNSGGNNSSGNNQNENNQNGSSTTTINSTSSNTISGDGYVSVALPPTVKYDVSKKPKANTFKYKNKEGKVITESKEEYSNVSVKFENGRIISSGLVPKKDYSVIGIDYTDDTGRARSLVINNVMIEPVTELQKYLANVYRVVFNRDGDEAGYHFHLNKLKNKEVSLREFLLNILNEKEFLEIYKTVDSKIEALYNAIVNRKSDSEGKNFWISEYNKLFKVYGSEELALEVIADRMVHENELKELSEKLEVKW